MNNQKIASELVDMADSLVGSAREDKAKYESIIDNLVYIEIVAGESQFSKYNRRRFTSVEKLDKFIRKHPFPDFGYDKIFLYVKLNDNEINSMRFDYSKKEPSFEDYFEWYVGKQISDGEWDD